MMDGIVSLRRNALHPTLKNQMKKIMVTGTASRKEKLIARKKVVKPSGLMKLRTNGTAETMSPNVALALKKLTFLIVVNTRKDNSTADLKLNVILSTKSNQLKMLNLMSLTGNA
jgi:hypothetical protein